ncbi:MAG: right-handed parallel beta-helix repeat-containing protein [Methanosarcinales archaeon]|nr:right-handed parallel beta-helix repeat-containing protein [Methanosarcinales archaeon]
MNNRNGIILIFALWFVFCGTATASQLYVNESGWWHDGGAFNYNSVPIQSALDNATDADTIFVQHGTYSGKIRINSKNLTIKGEDREITIIDGKLSGDCIQVSSADVGISGFTIKNAGGYGVYAYSSNLNLNNTMIKDCGKDAIHFKNGKTLTLRNSILENCDGGLQYHYTDPATGNATVKGNIIRNIAGNGLYIKLASGKSAVMTDNMIINSTGLNSNGIYCNIAGDGGLVSVKNNTIQNSGAHGIDLSGAKNVTIIDTIIDTASENGLYAPGCNLTIINTAVKNCGKDAIHFKNGKMLTLRDSILENCDGGLQYYYTDPATGNATVEGNIIRNIAGNGLYIKLASGKSAVMTDNMIINSTGLNSNGIYCNIVEDGGLVTMKNNTVENSGASGIYISGAEYSTIINNTISSNKGYGINLHSSDSNLLFHNDLINNSPNAYDSNPASNYWHHPVLLEGNYWSGYTGVDNGSGTGKHDIISDGIGDTDIPHPGMNYDYYPFVNKSGWTLPKLNIIHTHTDRIAYGLNKAVTISCVVQNDIEANISVDNINAKIIKPDGSTEWILLFEGLTGNYDGTFTNTSLFGMYDVTIYAYNIEYLTDTVELSFDVLPDHDIAITSIDAPGSTEANSIVLVNATINNTGLNSESNIAVHFIVDGIGRSSTTIPFIESRSYTNVCFQWTASSVDGRHDLLIYAEHVVNETIEWNNKLTKIITIGDIWVPDNYQTIQQAVNNAAAGDTIIIRDGIYTENVDVNKSVTILAENGSALTIVQAANPDDAIFEVTTDYVNISGFTVTGTDKAGFNLYGANRCNISDNNVSNNGKGIYLNYSGNCVLANNNASSNSGTGSYKRDGYGYGIYLNHSSNCMLMSNIANSNSGTGFYNYDGYGYGIYLNHSSYCTLVGNIANSNSGTGGEGHDPYEFFGGDGYSYGISLNNSGNCMLTSNTAYLNSGTGGIGESADEWNEWIGGSGGDSYGHGIYLQHSSNCMLTNNTANSISNGGRGGRGQYGGIGGDGGNSYSCGIYMDYSSNCILTGNTANSISDGGSGGHGIHDADGGDGGDGYGYGIYMDYSSNCILTSNSANSISNGGSGGSGGLGSGGSDGSDGSGYGHGIFLCLSSSNLIYNNHFNNTNNAFDNGNNIWSITKKAGTNIIGGPYLGGNYWSDYEGNDTNGDGLGDTLLPYNSSGNIRSGGDYHPLVQVNLLNEIISIASATLDINDTITVPVTIVNASDIQQVALVVIYDPDVISIINITVNNSVPSLNITYSLETGRALIELISSDKITAASATGLIDITFKSGGNNGTTVLMLQDIQLIDDVSSHAPGMIINGRITVCIKGDFNFNDRVDIGDVAKVAFMVAGKESEDLRADFNNNGRVDVGDAAKISFYLADKEDEL